MILFDANEAWVKCKPAEQMVYRANQITVENFNKWVRETEDKMVEYESSVFFTLNGLIIITVIKQER